MKGKFIPVGEAFANWKNDSTALSKDEGFSSADAVGTNAIICHLEESSSKVRAAAPARSQNPD